MKDISGQKFGKLRAISFKRIKHKRYQWLFECDCGNRKIIDKANVLNGNTKCCGCYKSNSSKYYLTHKKFNHVFDLIKQRTNNPNNLNFKNYGGRGIKCLWNGFEDFKNDMYESYLEHKKSNFYTSIERINNNGNYCKENCKWATHNEQANNRRCQVNLTYNGKTQCLMDWSKELGIKYITLYKRYYKNKSVYDILRN